MNKEIKDLIASYIKQISIYITYLGDKDWSDQDSIDKLIKDISFNSDILNEFIEDDEDEDARKEIVIDNNSKKANYYRVIKDQRDLEYGVVKGVLTNRNNIIKLTKGYHDTALMVEYTDLCDKIVDLHLHRVEEYQIAIENIVNNSNTTLNSFEIEFLELCTNGKFKLTLIKLSEKLDTEFDLNDLNLHADTPKAQLYQYKQFFNDFPEIEDLVKNDMGIDFDSPPNNKFHIYTENPPKWNPRRHFFEQEPETLQYYVDELKKMTDGVEIGGIFIEPWLYGHLNFFVTPIPNVVVKPSGIIENVDIIMQPPLRDNEWYLIQESYTQAKIEKKILFIAATRRLSKSTLMASHVFCKILTGAKELVVAGGSEKDLNQINKSTRIALNNTNPAFRVYQLEKNWTKKVVFGYRTKTQSKTESATIYVVNMDGGVENKSEIFAGFTPDVFIIDEAMKIPFKKQVEGALPSFASPHASRLVPIISGTGGNEKLAQDAFNILNNPDILNVLEMNWDLLNSKVEPKDRTWTEITFGTFAPAQMSAREGMIKIKTNLADYLKIDNAELRGIEIQVTDWEKCNELIRRDRNRKRMDRESYTKEVVYYPISPEEVFMTDKINPFPTEEAKIHLGRLKQNNVKPRAVDFVLNDGKYMIVDSNKPIAPFPLKGNIDSPVLLYDDIPEETPPPNLYISALDDYKQEESKTSNSVGSFMVYKRQSGGDPMGDRLVATYSSRPNPHKKFHKWGYQLIKAFNAKCYMENEDMEFKWYLDSIRETDNFLQRSFSLTGDITVTNNSSRKFGVTPRGNRAAIINRAVDYSNEEIEVERNGETIIIKGVERIDDYQLLEEIIAYNENLNVDRLTTFGIILIYAKYLDANYIEAPVIRKTRRDIDTQETERRRIKRGNPVRGQKARGSNLYNSAYRR